MAIPKQVFMHPKDKAALDALKRIPMVDELTRQFLHHFQERTFIAMLLATGLEITAKQKPEIYKWAVESSEQLGIPVPRIFMVNSYAPNAMAVGAKTPIIIVRSSLVTMLKEDEAKAVIAHECGHIACDHMLYRTLAIVLLEFGAPMLGDLGKLLSKPIEFALAYWSRMSEFSADRAAACAVGDAEPVKRSLMRLASGPQELTEDVDMELYMEQARDFDLAMDSPWLKYLLTITILGQSHPFAAARTLDLHKWQSSDEFQGVLAGRYPPSSDVKRIFES
jgi:Zn-dependent protease with chaperone function